MEREMVCVGGGDGLSGHMMIICFIWLLSVFNAAQFDHFN